MEKDKSMIKVMIPTLIPNGKKCIGKLEYSEFELDGYRDTFVNKCEKYFWNKKKQFKSWCSAFDKEIMNFEKCADCLLNLMKGEVK